MASLALGVKFIPASGGTGDFVYSAVVGGYRGSSALVDGKTYRYRAENTTLTEWEYGTGVWSSSTSTLTRATVAFSSTGAKVSFTLAPTVGIIQFVEDVLQFDDAMSLTAPQQAQARTNIGLGDAATKSLATTAEIKANTNANVITTDKAWDASKWVSLGNISGSVTIDASTGCRFYGTLTGNVTIDVSNLKDGQPLEMIFMQDATGGRTVGWASKFKWPGGTAPSVTATASSIALVASCEGTWDTSIVIGAGWKVT